MTMTSKTRVWISWGGGGKSLETDFAVRSKYFSSTGLLKALVFRLERTEMQWQNTQRTNNVACFGCS